MPKLTLYASHLLHNYQVLKQKLHTNTQLIPVVKANAYGSLAPQVAYTLAEVGAEYLAVAFVEEGIALRQAGIDNPILVFYPQREQFKALIEGRLEPAIYRFSDLRLLSELLPPTERYYPIHLKFNTGLNRLGFSTAEVESLMDELGKMPFLLKSVYSHLGATEDPRPQPYIDRQLELFCELKERIESKISAPITYHILNTSGLFNYPEFQMDAVRSGIGLHGFANQPQWDLQLKPVAELKTSIAQIIDVPKGDHVGYNFGWQAQRKSRIATLPIGHADGIGRYFGKGKAQVSIGDQKAPIVGNVCMDLLMIDITDLNVHEGDEVCFFGPDFSAAQWAEQGQTIAYELLTGIGSRVTRVWEP